MSEPLQIVENVTIRVHVQPGNLYKAWIEVVRMKPSQAVANAKRVESTSLHTSVGGALAEALELSEALK